MQNNIGNEPNVSVVIITYNRPNLAVKAIDSVLKQNYKNIEIIVVDSSTDNTKEILKPYIFNNFIRYFFQENKGISAARNFGIKNANVNSQYIALLDDDDVWFSNFLEKAIDALEGNRGLSVVTVEAELRFFSGEKFGEARGPILEFWRQPIGASWVFRKDLFFKENFWFDEKTLFDDLDLGIRVLEKHKGYIVPDPAWIHYGFPEKKGGSSCANPQRLILTMDYFLKKHEDLYKKLGKTASGFINFWAGKFYCKGGDIRKGRYYLKKAFTVDPSKKHFIYYLLSMIYPKIFQNYNLLVAKHKFSGLMLKFRHDV